jgi:hypothetical protein
MFKWLNKQGVASDQGFVVQFTGRDTLEYRRDKFVMECEVESLGGSQIAVAVPPLLFGNLTAQRRAEIIAEICAALEFQGLEVRIT